MFEDGFRKLKYINNYTKDKKLIQYIFNGIENFNHPTNEFITYNMTLEHILSQSDSNEDYVGIIGNLLPLSAKLNVEAKNSNFTNKIEIYKKSQYDLTKTFAKMNQKKEKWRDNDIYGLTINLAEHSYNNVWNLNS